MKNMRKLLDGVLQKIQPDEDYEKKIFGKIDLIIKKINKGGKGIRAVLGGSGAKGTWLKTFDADIFVLFDYKKYRGKSGSLSDILAKILKREFKNAARIHGSRDYFQIKHGKFTFEIVPILGIQRAEQAANITDVSPLHSKWVAKHRKLASEMKLTKQFCKAQGVYGAESHIRGFSGYICEILAVHYGSFSNLLKSAARWRDKTVIDVQGYYKGKDIFKIMNTSKLLSPLIVVDPVQKDRNAAAALSNEKFGVFSKAAQEFLKNPSASFFEMKDLKSEFMRSAKKGRKLMIISAEPLGGKADVVGSKLLKIHEFLIQKLAHHGFVPIRAGWELADSAQFYFIFNAKPIAEFEDIGGPPLSMKEHAAKFRSMHKKTFVKKGRLFAKEKRKFLHPEQLLRPLIRDTYILSRCKSIRLENFQ